MSDGKEVKQKECVTHHHACDCREAMHEAIVAELRAEVEMLKDCVETIRSQREDAMYRGRAGITQAERIDYESELYEVRAKHASKLAAIEKEGAK